MTTIVVDRDRAHGSELARTIRAAPNVPAPVRAPYEHEGAAAPAFLAAPDAEIAIVTDAHELPHLLAHHPEALVVVDEAAMGSTDALHRLIAANREAAFVVMVSRLDPTSITYLQDGARAILHRSVALRTITPTLSCLSSGMCPIPSSLVHLMLRHFRVGRDARQQAERLERLSPREREILELVLTGRDPAQVAEVLDLSVHTVRSHLKKVFRKVGVHSRLEAALVAVRAGEVPADPEAS